MCVWTRGAPPSENEGAHRSVRPSVCKVVTAGPVDVVVARLPVGFEVHVAVVILSTHKCAQPHGTARVSSVRASRGARG
jgi:hypothetical protein